MLQKQNAKKICERSTDQPGTAKAEPKWTVIAEAKAGGLGGRTEEDHNHVFFEPIYHPEAASSGGRPRKWLTIGKSAVLTFPEAPKKDG